MESFNGPQQNPVRRTTIGDLAGVPLRRRPSLPCWNAPPQLILLLLLPLMSDWEYDFGSSEVGDGRKMMETMANIATNAAKQKNDDVPMRICCRDALERVLFNYGV